MQIDTTTTALKAANGLIVANSLVHGRGLFVTAAISNGAHVVEYVGERITKSESLKRCKDGNPCIFALDDEFDLDGDVDWNPARFINHSCAPNCEAVRVDGLIFIVALRELQSGEELTFNYGYDLMDYHEHPCHCGNTACVGYMVAEAFFPLLRNKPQSKCGAV